MKTISQRTRTASEQTNYIVAPKKFQGLFGTHLPIISLIFFGLASSWIYLEIFSLGDLRGQIPSFLLLFLAASIFYLIACYLSTKSEDPYLLFTVLLFALIFRSILLFTTPTLSDDIYRYAWEGYLQSLGINPYRFPPFAPELIPYRNEIWQSVNNKDVAAIYPPMSQFVNLAAYFLFRSVWGFKLLFFILEGTLLWVLVKLLKLRGQKLSRIIFYAWNPLMVIEISGSGHQDVLVVATLIWAAYFCLTHRPFRTVLFLSASILSKVYPLLMIPFFLRRIRSRYWLWLPLTLGLGYLPYLRAKEHLFSALFDYKEKWRFNGFLFEFASRRITSEKAVEQIFVLFILLLTLFCLMRMKDLVEQLYWLTGGILLLAPTLFPWYLTWIIPFLCFFPNPAWILLSITSALSYYVLIDWWTLSIWRQDHFLMGLEYYAFWGLLLLLLMKTLILRNKNETQSSQIIPIK